MADLVYQYFKHINLDDPFFDSLKQDYREFPTWFAKKAKEGDGAFTFINTQGKIDGFLYLKFEDEPLNDISPPEPKKKRLKIGTLKINPHGTRLGEKFIKKALDIAVKHSIDETYLTVFSKHHGLIKLLEKYGFIAKSKKPSENGEEWVFFKTLSHCTGDLLFDYPAIPYGTNKYLISIYPKYHSKLFPDSILNTENPKDIVKDCSQTNSIHKIYLTRMQGTAELKQGDVLVIYRTTEQNKPAEYHSVATSVCVVEEVKHINDFATLGDFLRYTLSYSIFTESELRGFYSSKKYPVILKFTYNLALVKRIIRKKLIEEIGIDRGRYAGFIPLNNVQFDRILKLGMSDENYLIHKA